ncbi:MAG TPA: 3-methyl-2-oxobutanoate hydroxymethyltransferase [Candidatus Cloacimonadota bacterium]|nr:3-methyl-2-oxobutanoate hydroxymethyltransferase [Candidatus Cloacimonadota bacterium]HPT71037.1 3-methyl-2-oxobutanoate hydroxymethyltransferase [Candidatus Cloacimonadota bacterium]
MNKIAKQSPIQSLTINSFRKMKQKHEKIVMLTAYDYPSAKLAEAAGVDLLLVGDSVGMVVHGYPNTLQVSLEEMVNHTIAARNGAPNAFIVADMPYETYHISLEDTKRNAFELIIKGKADAVKIEGGSQSRLLAIQAIVDCEIPVVAHLGLTPQSIHVFGGYKVQGKEEKQYQVILEQAIAVEKAGAFMLVLEGIPEALGKEITAKVGIPTIGIGAGRYTDGQVMVYHDILGMSDLLPKFVKQYANLSATISKAIGEYIKDVKSEKFPAEEHIYFPIDKKTK